MGERNYRQENKMEGVIYKVTPMEVVISFKQYFDFPADGGTPFTVVMLANEITFTRCKQAMKKLKEY